VEASLDEVMKVFATTQRSRILFIEARWHMY